MNRPSNLPLNQPMPQAVPPPASMSRHMHGGHHNMRAPPQPLQPVAAHQSHHALPPPAHPSHMGYPPPTMANLQQRPTRNQNFHPFMDNSNNPRSSTSSYMSHPPLPHHQNSRMSQNQTTKKYHVLSRQKLTKPPPPTVGVHYQQDLPHHVNYVAAAPLHSKPENQAGSSVSSGLKTHSENPKIVHSAQSAELYAMQSKKFTEIPRQFELNYSQPPAVIANAAAKPTESLQGVELQAQLQSQTNSAKTILKPTDQNIVAECVVAADDNKKEEKLDSTSPSDATVKPLQQEPEGKLLEDDQGIENSDDPNDDSKENANLKSSREKTPMCLVNDLARFNKISFQYRLTGENGPAHCKRFTVTLKLGDEEYLAEGLKIKEAQHLAAKEAIHRTKYKHPIPKINRRSEEQGSSRVNVTPTVELNALAMKLGLQTYYIFDPRQPSNQDKVVCSSEKIMQQRYRTTGAQSPQLHTNANYGGGTFVPNLAAHHQQALMHVQHAASSGHHRGNFQHCYPVLPPHMMAAAQHLNSVTLFPTPCRITLIVGTQKFIGTGRTIQQAKHDAAAQAIEVLKEQMTSQKETETADEKSNDSDNKSPISLVFEIGIKRNLPVDFKILREDGPAHMRTFTTACIVGQIVTEAEGTGKKVSKKKAAQKMLEELNKLPPVVSPNPSPTKRVKTKTTAPRKPTNNAHHHKERPKEAAAVENTETAAAAKISAANKPKKRSGDSETDASNPITKLIELYQHNKEKEPIFKLITDGGGGAGKERSRQRQFVVEVSSNDVTVRGVGNSKKSARRNAAQNFLMSLGLEATEQQSSLPPPSNVSNQLEVSAAKIDNDKVSPAAQPLAAVAKIDTKQDSIAMAVNEVTKDETDLPAVNKEMAKQQVVNAAADISNVTQAPPTIASLPTSSASAAASTTTTSGKVSGFHMKDKLLYLARLMSFEVDFSDYPKGNHNEFLSIVMISTNPPQICHGIGANAQESQEDAASNALKILSEMGLNK